MTEVDRGGFWHVREATYMLLAAMEEEVREHFRVGAVENTQEGCRKILITAVRASDKVLFHCFMLTAEIEEVHAETVLDMLVSMWITIWAGMQAPWRCLSPVTLPALLLPREHAHSNNYGIAGVGGGALPASHNRQILVC